MQSYIIQKSSNINIYDKKHSPSYYIIKITGGLSANPEHIKRHRMEIYYTQLVTFVAACAGNMREHVALLCWLWFIETSF